MVDALTTIGDRSSLAHSALRTTRIGRHFPFFLAVAEELNLHRAAERLNVAQSALSRRIAELEAELGGTRLFERKARGLAITAAGAALVDEVRPILAAIDRAAYRTIRTGRGEEGTLALAFSEAMLRRPILGAILRRFREARPDVELRPALLTSDAQRGKLRGGEIDVGFVIEEPGDAADFALLPLGVDRFMLALPADHSLAREPEVDVARLQAEALIMPSRQISPRLFGRMMGALDRAALAPRIVAEASGADVTIGLISAGVGLGIMTAVDPATLPAGVVLRGLRGFDLPLPISMIWARNGGSPVVARFVDLVRAMVAGGATLDTRE